MHKIALRRTFNIGNYESLSVEATGEHDDAKQARLIASRLILEAAQLEMIRIFHVRSTTNCSQSVEQLIWNHILLELNGVLAELNS